MRLKTHGRVRDAIRDSRIAIKTGNKKVGVGPTTGNAPGKRSVRTPIIRRIEADSISTTGAVPRLRDWPDLQAGGACRAVALARRRINLTHRHGMQPRRVRRTGERVYWASSNRLPKSSWNKLDERYFRRANFCDAFENSWSGHDAIRDSRIAIRPYLSSKRSRTSPIRLGLYVIHV